MAGCTDVFVCVLAKVYSHGCVVQMCLCLSMCAAFLSVDQQWRWLGDYTQRPGLKGRARKLYYKAIQRGNETLRVCDSHHVTSVHRPVFTRWT